MVDFTALLSKKAAAVEKPKPIPPGTAHLVIKSHEFGESAQKKTPYVRYHFQVTGPGDDMDPDLIEAAGGIQALLKKTLRTEFYLTEDALWRLTDFLEGPCGLEFGDRSLQELIPEAVNKALLGTIGHRNSQDGKEVYAEITSFAAAE